LPRLITFPPNIVLRLMVNRNGSANEGSNRWQSAGFFPAKRFESMPLAWIAESQFKLKSEMGSS
jgi:hypothetical protein